MARETKGPKPSAIITWIPLLLAALGLPLALKLIAPNPLYGFRTEATLSSESVWYSANLQTGIALLFFGCLGTIANVYIARSKTLSPTLKQLLPIGTLLTIAALSIAAGSAAT